MWMVGDRIHLLETSQQSNLPAGLSEERRLTNKGNFRFSKAAAGSSNTGFHPAPIPENESYSQLREIDDTEEIDAESLMKTQSIRLSTQRVHPQALRGSANPSVHFSKKEWR